jgi:hypothetical protein
MYPSRYHGDAMTDLDTERRRLIRTLLPATSTAGLLDALLDVEALLASQEHHGAQRWRGLGLWELACHLRAHIERSEEGSLARDGDTGHLHAAHAAARALMWLAARREE